MQRGGTVKFCSSLFDAHVPIIVTISRGSLYTVGGFICAVKYSHNPVWYHYCHMTEEELKLWFSNPPKGTQLKMKKQELAFHSVDSKDCTDAHQHSGFLTSVAKTHPQWPLPKSRELVFGLKSCQLRIRMPETGKNNKQPKKQPPKQLCSPRIKGPQQQGKAFKRKI